MRRFMTTILLLPLMLTFSCQSADEDTAGIESENQLILVESGELQALQSKVIPMPSFDWSYGRPQIVGLADEGTVVSKGDVVGTIDTSGVVRVLGQKQAEMEIAQADLNKQAVEHSSQIEKLEAELLSAEAALGQARIDTQRVRFESPAKQEVSRLKLKIAEIALRKAERKKASTLIIQREEKRIQEAKIRQTLGEIDKAKRTIQRFILRAPADGMVVYRKKGREGLKVSVGDQLYPGQAMIELPDLSQIKVLTAVNETDIEKVKPGQQTTIRLDAYPKMTFSGKITHVSRICRKKEKDSSIKVFDVEVLLGESARVLRPGMTVSCEIKLGSQIPS